MGWDWLSWWVQLLAGGFNFCPVLPFMIWFADLSITSLLGVLIPSLVRLKTTRAASALVEDDLPGLPALHLARAPDFTPFRLPWDAVSIPKLVPRDPGGPSWPYTFHGGLQGICQVFQLFLGQGPEHHDLPQGTHLQGTGRSAMDPRSPRNKASISQPKIMYHHLSSSIIIYHHLSSSITYQTYITYIISHRIFYASRFPPVYESSWKNYEKGFSICVSGISNFSGKLPMFFSREPGSAMSAAPYRRKPWQVSWTVSVAGPGAARAQPGAPTPRPSKSINIHKRLIDFRSAVSRSHMYKLMFATYIYNYIYMCVLKCVTSLQRQPVYRRLSLPTAMKRLMNAQNGDMPPASLLQLIGEISGPWPWRKRTEN